MKKPSFTKKDSRDELLCNDGDVLVQSIRVPFSTR